MLSVQREKTLVTCLSYMKHLFGLYQASLNDKRKDVEADSVLQSDDSNDDPIDITHFDVSNFFDIPEKAIDHLVGDRNI